MWKYLRALGYLFTGRLAKARAALMENEYVMAATYDASIKKGDQRLLTTRESVADLIRIEQELLGKVKGLGAKMQRLEAIKKGAQTAMQNRINALKDTKTKEQILQDADFIKHKSAFEDADRDYKAAVKEYDEKNADLTKRQGQIATYKAKMATMQRGQEALKAEKSEAIADVQIAKQSEAIDAQLAGLTTDAEDEDLKSAREARERAKARATITAELAGVDHKSQENEYLNLATAAGTAAELDGLLDFGDGAKTEKSEPAKLPE